MTKPKPKLTMEGLRAAMGPPNNCKIKAFRDLLDEDSRLVFDEAIKLPGKDFPGSALRAWLVNAGIDEAEVPGDGSISDHRAGRRPCRCRG